MPDPTRASPPPGSGPGPGARLAGRYRLERMVAAGGMAQVWRAVDEALQRPVAVKILHPHLAADETFGARFRQEAVAAARLAHPSIVAIYDTCRQDDLDAIVMELVEGDTLRAHLDERQVLAPDEAVAIASQILDALDEAHRQGMVHRDIKPANVLLLADGRAKVADFGIAKLDEQSDLTTDGMMVGTAKYLAPEQVRSEAVDPRTDLYSVAVVLYEMLTGRPPFQGSSAAETALARLTTEPPRPRQVMATVPPALDEVVMRGLAREPADRYQFASDFRAALTQPAAGGDATAVEPVEADLEGLVDPDVGFVRRERNWIVPTLLIVLVALALGLAGVLLGRTEAGQGLIDRVTGQDSGGGTPAALVEARAFDPEGDGSENDGDAPRAIDDDPATTWHSEGYNNRDVTVLKSGVGIIVVLDARRTLDEVVITSPTNDWAGRLYVADTPAGDLAGWGEPVTTFDGVESGTFTVDDVGGRAAGAVLLWITDVGDGPPRTQFDLAEIDVTVR